MKGGLIFQDTAIARGLTGRRGKNSVEMHYRETHWISASLTSDSVLGKCLRGAIPEE